VQGGKSDLFHDAFDLHRVNERRITHLKSIPDSKYQTKIAQKNAAHIQGRIENTCYACIS
jgi:hypothetical protein